MGSKMIDSAKCSQKSANEDCDSCRRSTLLLQPTVDVTI